MFAETGEQGGVEGNTVEIRSLLAAGLAAFAVFAAGDGRAAPQTPASLAALDAAVADVLTDARVPGAALIVIEDGQVVFSRNYGVSDLSTRAPVVDDTVFRAGSISKSFTSIGVMTLVEEGRLSLDAEVAPMLVARRVRHLSWQV